MRVVDTPGRLWNSLEKCYQVAYNPKLKYPEKLRHLFPSFVRENITPEASDPAA